MGTARRWYASRYAPVELQKQPGLNKVATAATLSQVTNWSDVVEVQFVPTREPDWTAIVTFDDGHTETINVPGYVVEDVRAWLTQPTSRTTSPDRSEAGARGAKVTSKRGRGWQWTLVDHQPVLIMRNRGQARKTRYVGTVAGGLCGNRRDTGVMQPDGVGEDGSDHNGH